MASVLDLIKYNDDTSQTDDLVFNENPRGTRGENDEDEKDDKQQTIHPRSKLPVNVKKVVLRSKYCELLDFCYQLQEHLQQTNLEKEELKELNEKLQEEIETLKSNKEPNNVDSLISVPKMNIPFNDNEEETITIPIIKFHELQQIEDEHKVCTILKQQEVDEKEEKMKLNKIRKQQKAVQEKEYFRVLSQNKMNINDLSNLALVKIPGIGHTIKNRLIAYISQNPISHIDDLKGKVHLLGDKRLMKLKAIFYCAPLYNNINNNLPYEEEEEEDEPIEELNLPL